MAKRSAGGLRAGGSSPAACGRWPRPPLRTGGSGRAWHRQAAARSRLAVARARTRSEFRSGLCVAAWAARRQAKRLVPASTWWARQDSNLQPDGYEPPALTIELRAPPAKRVGFYSTPSRVTKRFRWAWFGQEFAVTSGRSCGRDREAIMGSLRHILIAAAFAAIALCDPRTAMAADGDKAERLISVTASGHVDAEPDLASVSVGAIVEADTAKGALAHSSTLMAKLIEGLKALGIAAKDIQTTAIAIEPRYAPSKDGRPAALAGYRLVNRVHLTVREVKRLGEILDGAIGLGANQINGIGFEVSNAETLMGCGRRLAIANARRRAELYAAAAGAQPGQVLTISEATNASPRAVPMARAAAGGPVPIEAGTRTLTVDVNVTYALR